MTTLTAPVPMTLDWNQLMRTVTDLPGLEPLESVMSADMQAAVHAWRAARGPAREAIAKWHELSSDDALAKARAADAKAAEEAIIAGDFSDPATTNVDKRDADLRAATRAASHLTSVSGEAMTRVVDLAHRPGALAPMDPAQAKAIRGALDRLAGPAADLDRRATFIAWRSEASSAHGRRDTPAPRLDLGPATAALAALGALLDGLATTGTDGA